MKTNKTHTLSSINLIDEAGFIRFLEIQANYGLAQRGGSGIPTNQKSTAKRLVNNINILESSELKKIVFNELIFGN